MPSPRSRSICVALLLAVNIASCASSTVIETARSPSPEESASPWNPIDALFVEWDRPDSPGCALGIVRDGRLVHARGFGAANLEHELPIGPRTVFDIGSTSKQFTAACIGLLHQDGKLSVDDDVRRWVPELRDYGEPITVQHLLHHTSGLRDYLELFMLAGRRGEDYTTEGQALAMIVRQRELNFAPGSEHLYSNSGYFLLSIVVERAGGKSLPEFARERIFEPLAMSDTHIHDDHTLIVPRRATGYSPRASGGFGIDMSDYEQTGDGSVMTTVEDLARWDANFTTHAVGGEELQRFLHEHGRLDDGSELAYASGLRVDTWRGLARTSHGGAWAGYRAELVRFPSERLSVICLANLGSIRPSQLCAQVAELLLEGKVAPEGSPAFQPADTGQAGESAVPSEKPAPPALAEVAGRYHSEELAADLELAWRAGKLFAGEPGIAGLELASTGPDELGIEGFRLCIERSPDGSVSGLRASSGRMRNLAYVRVR